MVLNSTNAARSYLLSWLFRNAQAPSWLFGPRTDVLAEPHLIGPVQNDFVILFLYIAKIKKGQQNRTICIFQQVTVPVMRKFHVQTIDNVSASLRISLLKRYTM
jgi:hypothetical protein